MNIFENFPGGQESSAQTSELIPGNKSELRRNFPTLFFQDPLEEFSRNFEKKYVLAKRLNSVEIS